uniref:Uncharacterized protein n=1 Tax=Buteo japonicus TaxID=224669 RepID=A0A8C0B810_9AVES
SLCARPWSPRVPPAFCRRAVVGAAVPQETLDLTCRKAPCFVKFSEMEKMANIQAEINEVQPLLLSPYCKAV